MRGPKGAGPTANKSTKENCENYGCQRPDEGFQMSARCNESCQSQQRIKVKETLNRTYVILPRVMSFQQQVNKQAEEKGLAQDPESLKQSMIWRTLFFQNNISPANTLGSNQAEENTREETQVSPSGQRQ